MYICLKKKPNQTPAKKKNHQNQQKWTLIGIVISAKQQGASP